MTKWKRLTCLAALCVAALCAPTSGIAVETRIVLTQDDGALESALEAASLSLAAQRDGVTESADLLAAAQADYGRMVTALYARGYYGPKVLIKVDGREAALIDPLSPPSTIGSIDIEVDTGGVFQFGTARIAPLANGTELPLGFAAEEVAESNIITAAAGAAIEGWRDEGHAKADLSSESIVADHNINRLNVDLKVSPGPKLTFGDLTINGNKDVRLTRLYQIAGYPSGDIFSPAQLDRVVSRIRRTGAFKSVSVTEAETANPDGTLDAAINVVEQTPRRFGFGAEIFSNEGLELSSFWLHRNFSGGAERLRLDGIISGIGGDTGGVDYGIDLRYDRPATFNADTTLFGEGSISHEDEPLYTEDSAELSFGLKRYFSEELSAEFAIGLRHSKTEDDLGVRRFNHLILPVSAEWDRRDDQLNPTDGFYLQGETIPFIGVAGSETGLRATLDARGYQSLGDRFVFAARIQLGSIMGTSIAETPSDYLFFSGGGGTVRGQPYQSLAIDDGVTTTGGLSFLGVAAEMRGKINETFSLVGFFDSGFISDDSFGQNASFHSGAGVGVRYNTGIGPIRLDVGVPLGGNTGDGFQIYVGIGQAF